MHIHNCRHCNESFVCGEDAAECFRRFIVCDDCFWSVEMKHFALVVVLAVIAVGLTMFVAENFK